MSVCMPTHMYMHMSMRMSIYRPTLSTPHLEYLSVHMMIHSSTHVYTQADTLNAILLKRKLRDGGNSVDVTDICGRTPLAVACFHGSAQASNA